VPDRSAHCAFSRLRSMYSEYSKKFSGSGWELFDMLIYRLFGTPSQEVWEETVGSTEDYCLEARGHPPTT
jgi:hypothetical protein